MKKWFKVLMLVCVSILLVGWYVFDNLKFNAVYYAKHTPHKEGVEPVLMTLIDELYWIKTESLSNYDYNKGSSISIMENGKQKYLYHPSHDFSNDTRQYTYSGDLLEKKVIFLMKNLN